MEKRRLEFPKHGNRVWHRCRKVYEAWKKLPVDDDPIVAVGAYLMSLGEDDARTVDGVVNLECATRNCLVPMYKIGEKYRGSELPIWGEVIPAYVCPACQKIYTLKEVQSGRTVNFGVGLPQSRKAGPPIRGDKRKKT